MHKVFISFHHKNDQCYKDYLVKWAEENKVFIDGSVDAGDISDNLSDEEIRLKIRDEYLKDTTVTILLVGTETKHRKHIDWEIYSSMYDGKINKKSGIIVILLPSVKSDYCTAAHEGEKTIIFDGIENWKSINTRMEYEERYPYLPERIIDNLLNNKSKISVVNWDTLLEYNSNTNSEELSKEKLTYMIDMANKDKSNCEYDLSRIMRRKNG